MEGQWYAAWRRLARAQLAKLSQRERGALVAICGALIYGVHDQAERFESDVFLRRAAELEYRRHVRPYAIAILR